MKKKETKEKKSHKKLIISISAFLLLAIAAVAVYLFFIADKGTYKIAKALSKKLSNDYTDITVVKGKTDTKSEYTFKEVTYIYIKSIGEEKDEGNSFAIAISEYNSEFEAEKRKEIINDFSNYRKEKLKGSVFELFDEYESWISENTIVTKGKYLFSINPKVQKKEKVLEYIDTIMKKYKFKDSKEPNKTKISEYYEKETERQKEKFDESYSESLNSIKQTINDKASKFDNCKGDNCKKILDEILLAEKYEEVADEVKAAKDKYDVAIKQKENLAKSITDSISNLKKTLNRDKYNEIKNQIDKLDDSFYNKYKDNWKTQLVSIDESIFKNSCKKYNYKDLLRNPDTYKNQNAYFFGRVLQKVSSTQYRVGVDCTKYTYIEGYNCANTIYVNYLGSLNLIEDDMVKLWGYMDGTQTYTTVLGASVTIPKLYAKYAQLQ